jgi:deoxyribonuclease II
MKHIRSTNKKSTNRARLLTVLPILLCIGSLAAQTASAPTPLLDADTKVDWWFVFKFNAESFPNSCPAVQRACPFGGSVQPYRQFSQQFAYASSADHKLQQGGGCVGVTTADPLGATFSQAYNGKVFYVLWNDQFYGDPIRTESAPAGHSKGMLAWDKDGNGFVLQVSTPDWPAAGSSKTPRKTDGNTLGCIAHDNDVMVSQYFFSLKLTKSDVAVVLKALANSSVVTDPTNKQIVNNGGPADIQALVTALGKDSSSTTPTKDTLSSGVVLISKPSNLHVPPWQMVSALLGGEPLRAATWWTRPEIPTTTATTPIPQCWDRSLGNPGPVEIATTGAWKGQTIGLEGVADPEGNHAKIGVSTTGTHSYAIFGDMNQQGSLSGPNCKSSQNGRGGLFYVVEDAPLHDSLRDLIQGNTAPAN